MASSVTNGRIQSTQEDSAKPLCAYNCTIIFLFRFRNYRDCGWGRLLTSITWSEPDRKFVTNKVRPSGDKQNSPGYAPAGMRPITGLSAVPILAVSSTLSVDGALASALYRLELPTIANLPSSTSTTGTGDVPTAMVDILACE